MIGHTLSHYQPPEKIGKGGLGVAYKARDTRLCRFVALKFLSGEIVSDSGALEPYAARCPPRGGGTDRFPGSPL